MRRRTCCITLCTLFTRSLSFKVSTTGERISYRYPGGTVIPVRHIFRTRHSSMLPQGHSNKKRWNMDVDRQHHWQIQWKPTKSKINKHKRVFHTMIRRRQSQQLQEMSSSFCGVAWMMLLLLVVMSSPLSSAFTTTTTTTTTTPCYVAITTPKIDASFLTTFRHHQQQRPPPSRTIAWVATTDTTTTSPPPPPESSSPQLVDDEYFTALQNFASPSSTSSSTTVNTAVVPSSTTSSSWRDDGFIFGLNQDLQRPTGKQALIVVEGDSMETKPYQVALVSVTLLNHLYYIATSILDLYHTSGSMWTTTTLQILLLSGLSWISADFGSGVLHWSVDNYGNGRTPIMGNIIAAFQGHHTAPWTITQRSFFNNVYKLCIPFGIVPVTLIAYATGPMLTLFLTIFCVLEILSQEFHKWSHQTKSETPWIGTVLQKYHLSIGRVPHTKHHTLPFETNYCIISGRCNPILDRTGFFRRLEHWIYQRNGIESNAWKLDPVLRQRTLNGIYTPPPPTGTIE